MSRKPYPAGVHELISLIDRIQDLQTEQRGLEPQVKQLEAVKAGIIHLDKELTERLRTMDVDFPGNHGWDGRFSWVIAEVMRQMRDPSRASPHCDGE